MKQLRFVALLAIIIFFTVIHRIDATCNHPGCRITATISNTSGIFCSYNGRCPSSRERIQEYPYAHSTNQLCPHCTHPIYLHNLEDRWPFVLAGGTDERTSVFYELFEPEE